MKAASLVHVVCFVVVALVAPSQTSAQDDSLSSVTVSAARLTEISLSLARIADLLEAQTESRRLELVMQRIEVRARRLAPLEARLRSARSSRDNYQEEQFRLQKQLEITTDRLDSGAVEIDPDEITSMTDHFASELALVTARLRATNDEIAALENEVAGYRNDIDDWEAWVDRELGDL